MSAAPDLTCAELVELVTAYLDRRLPAEDAARIERHLASCEGCSAYLEQMRATIAAAGALRADALPPALEEALLEAFRGRRSS